jgi:hypothetical protein
LGDPHRLEDLHDAFPGLGAVERLDEASALAFARRWNEASWHNTFWCYYEPEDENPATRLRLFEGGGRKSLSDLPPAYHTAENYTLMSKKFGLATFSVVPASETRGIIRRIESRFMDSGGPEQVEILAALTHALAFDAAFGAAVDGFLEACGFKPRAPKESFDLLLRSLQSAALDSYNTLADIRYGRGDAGNAAKRLAAQVLKAALNRYPGLAPLIRICESGQTQALHFRKQDGASVPEFRQKLMGSDGGGNSSPEPAPSG